MRDEDNRLVVNEDAAALMVQNAEDILAAFITDGPDALPPLAIALAHLVKDYLA